MDPCLKISQLKMKRAGINGSLQHAYLFATANKYLFAGANKALLHSLSAVRCTTRDQFPPEHKLVVNKNFDAGAHWPLLI